MKDPENRGASDVLDNRRFRNIDSGDDREELADIIPIGTATTWSASKDYLKFSAVARDAVTDASTQVFTALINLSFAGELNGKDDKFGDGDQVCFSAGDFQDVQDPRVQLLLGLYLELTAAADNFRDYVADNKPAPAKPPYDPDPFGDRHPHFAALARAKGLLPPLPPEEE